MPIASELRNLLRSGVHRMGELEFQTNVSNHFCIVTHWQDAGRVNEPGFGGLERHDGPSAARDLACRTEDGQYRFNKGQTNLQRGWMMVLESGEDLRQALDQFYPAGVGVFLAHRNDTLEVENLRDKLQRQSGMYRLADKISDAGAQQLIRKICGPNHACARRILWQIDAHTPLDDSEASRFSGIPAPLAENEAIPLLCREACNFFVEECRKAAQEEMLDLNHPNTRASDRAGLRGL